MIHMAVLMKLIRQFISTYDSVRRSRKHYHIFERIKNWPKFSIQAIIFKDVTINANMHTRDFYYRIRKFTWKCKITFAYNEQSSEEALYLFFISNHECMLSFYAFIMHRNMFFRIKFTNLLLCKHFLQEINV